MSAWKFVVPGAVWYVTAPTYPQACAILRGLLGWWHRGIKGERVDD